LDYVNDISLAQINAGILDPQAAESETEMPDNDDEASDSENINHHDTQVPMSSRHQTLGAPNFARVKGSTGLQTPSQADLGLSPHSMPLHTTRMPMHGVDSSIRQHRPPMSHQVPQDPATVVVHVTLPRELTLAHLVAVPHELGDGDVAKLASLMRPLLPRQMGALEPCEINEGLASLKEDLIRCMSENVAHHHEQPCPSSSMTYAVQAQHRLYRASKEDVLRFIKSVAHSSVWFENIIVATKSLSEWEYKKPGGKYDNRFRVEALVLAMVQVLFPHFSDGPLRHPDERYQDSMFDAHKCF
jgi:hypothetical protein